MGGEVRRWQKHLAISSPRFAGNYGSGLPPSCPTMLYRGDEEIPVSAHTLRPPLLTPRTPPLDPLIRILSPQLVCRIRQTPIRPVTNTAQVERGVTGGIPVARHFGLFGVGRDVEGAGDGVERGRGDRGWRWGCRWETRVDGLGGEDRVEALLGLARAAVYSMYSRGRTMGHSRNGRRPRPRIRRETRSSFSSPRFLPAPCPFARPVASAVRFLPSLEEAATKRSRSANSADDINTRATAG